MEFADPLGEGGGSPPAGRSAWRRLIARHVDQCPACRGERAANERLVRMLKEAERQSAPPGLLPAVMARIAAERAVRGGEDARARGERVELREVRQLRRAFRPADGLEAGAAFCVLAFLCGWAGFVSASGWLVGFLQAAPALTDAAMAVVRTHASETTALMGQGARLGAGVVPPGFDPYATALFWTAVGLAAALVTPVILRTEARP